MRAQTSLEFLLILSIVSVVGLSALVFYGKGMKLNSESLSAFQSQPSTPEPGNISTVSDPELLIYIPINSTLLSNNVFQVDGYGCADGRANLSLHSSTVQFSQENISFGINNVTMISGQFEPTSPGLNKVQVDYSVSCGSVNKSSSQTLATYASTATQGGSQVFAYISRRNETIDYGISESPVLTLEESNLCTITDVWTGRVYTVPGQCGTSNAWDYQIYDPSCLQPYWSYSRTYCVYPVDTEYTVSSIDPYNYTYSYNISARVYTPEGLLTSNLSDTDPSAAVFLDGSVVGNATVVGVSESSYTTETDSISDDSGSWAANNSAYAEYVQDENNLYSTLGFYNSSGVSGPTQSSIQEAISAFNSSSSGLISSRSASGKDDCMVDNDSYLCPALAPFAYTIYINVSESLGIQNATMYYQDSEINLVEK